MTNINKKDRRTEPFDRAKLERSIRDADIDENTAREIARKVPEKEGITTDEIRRIVAEELKKRKPEAAERYTDTRRLAARKAVDAVKGIARLTKETMSMLKVKSGDTINVLHRDKTHKVRTEIAPVDRKEIQLHEEDLRTIGASDGTRVAVQRSR